MPYRIPELTLRRVQLRMRPLLRQAGRYHEARQSQGQRNAGSDSPVQTKPAQIRHRWFAERAHIGTPLSESELQHGVQAGLISGLLLS